MLSRTKVPRIVRARQGLYMVLHMRGNSLSWIGRRLDRDHTTIMHGVTVAECLMAHDKKFAASVNKIAEMVAEIEEETGVEEFELEDEGELDDDEEEEILDVPVGKPAKRLKSGSPEWGCGRRVPHYRHQDEAFRYGSRVLLERILVERAKRELTAA